MSKLASVLLVCVTRLLGFAQSPSKYQAATVVEVVPLTSLVDGREKTPVYYISLRVKDTVYVVLYNASSSTESLECLAGIQLLVLVCEDTIQYYDMLGWTFEVPIVKRRPATGSQSK